MLIEVEEKLAIVDTEVCRSLLRCLLKSKHGVIRKEVVRTLASLLQITP